jgi:hypothetical protein
MIFPFYGIKEYKQKRIWFIKPKSGNIINTLKKIIKNVKEDMWINSDWNKRFNNFRQMYVSYKYGHKFWESKTGLYIAEYFGFDNSVYNTLKIPENIIKIKNPKNVNKWLKYRE